MTHPEVKRYLAELGRKGGRARAKKLTKQRLSEIGRRAAEARVAQEKHWREKAEGKGA